LKQLSRGHQVSEDHSSTRTLAAAPHLGYVHVRLEKADFAKFKERQLAFLHRPIFPPNHQLTSSFFNSIDPRLLAGLVFCVAMKKQGRWREAVSRCSTATSGTTGSCFQKRPKTALKDNVLSA